MAFFSDAQLRDALEVLDKARRTTSCPEPRKNFAGETARYIPARMGRKHVHKEFEQPFGIHGHDYLVVDPATKLVHCGACVGELDSTVQEKAVPRPLPDNEAPAPTMPVVKR